MTCWTLQQDSDDATVVPLVQSSGADYSKLPIAKLPFWGYVEIQRYSALHPSCPLPSTAALHKMSHRCLLWLQKSCLSGLFFVLYRRRCSEPSQYQAVPWCCDCAAQTVLHLELPHFLRSSCLHCGSLGCFCPVPVQYKTCK